jgi:hypothetical protein
LSSNLTRQHYENSTSHRPTLLCCVLYQFCAVLCCAVLCCAVLCCAVLCCAVLCFVLLFSQSMNLNETYRLLSGDDSASESVGIITHYREEHIMSFKTTETNERR